MIEDLHTEFKREWSDKYLKNIAAFANTDGGVLYIGIDDAGEITGVKDVKTLLKKIPDTIQNVLGIVPVVDNHEENGKSYISIKISKHDDLLFCDGKIYVKSGSTTRELKGRELRIHLMKSLDMSWSDEVSTIVPVEDLDGIAYREFIKKAIKKKMLKPEEEKLGILAVFEKMDLCVKGHPKLGAVLLFHPEPTRFTAGACVQIGMFRDSDLLYQDLIKGPLFLIPDKVVDLIFTKYIIAPVTYEGIYRVENTPYPFEAIREAVLNSIIHADYGAKTPIQIKVFPDRLMIANDGSPPEDWTVDMLLKSHKSHPGNPSMAEVFHRAGMVERFGRGIQTIMSEYEGKEDKVPVFNFNKYEFIVTFFNENYVENIPNSGIPLSEPEKRLIQKMSDAEYSLSELVEIASSGNRESFRRHVIKPLVDKGFIEMTVKDKPTSMKQKYVLTDSGRVFKKNQ